MKESRYARMATPGIAVVAVLMLVAVMLVMSGCGKTPDAESPAAASTADATADDGRLTIAVAGMVTPASGLEYYKGLADYVGAQVGLPVRIIHKADYTQVNQMLRDGKVDVAFVCSGPYVAGHDEFGVELIAAPVVNGQPRYFSYIIVPKSSPATSLASLKGKTFAFTDPESNTGYIVPSFMLTSVGENPAEFFGKVYYTYGHDNSIKAVATGEADGAAVDSLIWDYQNATDAAYTARTRIIQKSQEFAIPPVVARPGLDPTLVKKIRASFLGAHENPQGKALLEHMKIEKFVEIEDSAYDSIRDMNQRLAK